MNAPDQPRGELPGLLLTVAVIAIAAVNPGRGQSPAPAAAPGAAVTPPTAAGVSAAPLTAAQKAVLQGALAALVAPFEAETGIRLVPIPAGTFLMGSPAAEAKRFPDEGPQTRVTLTKDFLLGATDVTQAQWTAVMGTNPSHFKGGTLPVDSVTWDDAMAFGQKLTERERAAGRLPAGYVLTLPTEAQWEYACRAGTTVGDPGDMHVLAWFAENSDGTTHPVGTKPPNEWGLFDMHGNVWQWCRDWFKAYPGGAVTDPTGAPTGLFRVIRGGSWDYDAAFCRYAFRRNDFPDERDINVGFRLALVPAP
jgi:formylglycine-generating enzyme required for sulfatase activity